MNKLMNIKIPTTFLVYIGLFLFSLALTISAMLWFNKYAKYFIKESSIVESSAVFFLLLSSFVAILATIGAKQKIVPIFYSIAGFLFFLEEISWGWAIVRYYERPLVMGVKIDSLHDFIEVFLMLLGKYWHSHLYYFVLIGVFCSALILFILIKKWNFFAKFISGEKRYFFGAILLLLFLSTAFDTGVFRIKETFENSNVVLEEFFEFNIALALFFICLSLLPDKPMKTINKPMD